MTLFLLTFFLVYGGVHAYAFWKARAALDLGLRSSIALILFMALMVLAPVLIRLAEKAGLPFLPRILAYIGYLWMGLLFLFFSASVAMDIYRLLVHAGGMLFQKDLSLYSLQPGTSFAIALAFSIFISVYGYFEAGQIRIEQVTIRSPKISAAMGRVRIVQISDVHLGLIVREQRLKRIIQKVREAGPDLLVSTGDLVDGNSLVLFKSFLITRPHFT
ncbi:MAG: metallophosphoesterase, partial [bacterium]